MRGRERLTGRERRALHRRLQPVVVAVGAAALDRRDPPQHRAVGDRVVDAARPRHREHVDRARPRATGSSTRGSGHRCARRGRRCRLPRRSRSPTAIRSRSGSTIVSAASRTSASSARAGFATDRDPARRRTPRRARRCTTAAHAREQLRLGHEHLRRRSGGPCGGAPRRAARSDRPGRRAWPAWRPTTSSGSSTSARARRATPGAASGSAASVASARRSGAASGGRRPRPVSDGSELGRAAARLGPRPIRPGAGAASRLDRGLGLTGADAGEQRVDVGEAGVGRLVARRRSVRRRRARAAPVRRRLSTSATSIASVASRRARRRSRSRRSCGVVRRAPRVRPRRAPRPARALRSLRGTCASRRGTRRAGCRARRATPRSAPAAGSRRRDEIGEHALARRPSPRRASRGLVDARRRRSLRPRARRARCCASEYASVSACALGRARFGFAHERRGARLDLLVARPRAARRPRR